MKALIVSLNFNPGHFSHLIASYKQCKELGFIPYLYIDKRFVAFIVDPEINYFTSGNIPAQFHKNDFLVFFWFPSVRNILEIIKFSIQSRSKYCYVFHEPFDSLINYYKSGFSYSKILKIVLVNLISLITVFLSSIVLLPSNKAYSLYYKHKNNLINKKAYLLPLLFDDEQINSKQRIDDKKYFSYIGTVAEDHAFDEYLDFADHCITNNLLPQFKFLIATKSQLNNYVSQKKSLFNSDRISVASGVPMSNEEINAYYAMSSVIWNAYHRTMQSGVLPKAFMFGTPVIALKKNENEFTHNYNNCILINDNKSEVEILGAADYIFNHQAEFYNSCRQSFLNHFYYKNKNSDLQLILNKCDLNILNEDKNEFKSNNRQ